VGTILATPTNCAEQQVGELADPHLVPAASAMPRGGRTVGSRSERIRAAIYLKNGCGLATMADDEGDRRGDSRSSIATSARRLAYLQTVGQCKMAGSPPNELRRIPTVHKATEMEFFRAKTIAVGSRRTSLATPNGFTPSKNQSRRSEALDYSKGHGYPNGMRREPAAKQGLTDFLSRLTGWDSRKEIQCSRGFPDLSVVALGAGPGARVRI
jgi:hypothetical protein